MTMQSIAYHTMAREPIQAVPLEKSSKMLLEKKMVIGQMFKIRYLQLEILSLSFTVVTR